MMVNFAQRQGGGNKVYFLKGTSKNLWRARFFKIFPSGLFDFEGNPWWIGRKTKEKTMVKYKKYDRQEVF